MSLGKLSRGSAILASTLGLVAPAVVQAAEPGATAAPPYTAADWKQIPAENLMVIDTTKGRIIVEFTPTLAPEHVQRVKQLVQQGYYDGLKFFRVIDDFMAQTGDKANTGAGDSGLPKLQGTFSFRRGPDSGFSGVSNGHGVAVGFVGPSPVSSQPDELMGLTTDGKVRAVGLFCPGVAGMARTSDPNSAATQFFLMRQYRSNLDGAYTPWGRVVVGLEVLRALTVGEPPANPDSMIRVRLASDMPAAERPNVWRIDTASADFRAHLMATMAARGSDFTPCDVEVPGEIRK
jgi:peptidylprolyl isomerase